VTGRTRTAPVSPQDSLEICGRHVRQLEWATSTRIARMADRNNLDAVIHLGDYIYEHATGVYGDTTIGRIYRPTHEVISLPDYRRDIRIPA